MPITFTSASRKYQSIQTRGLIGEFTATVTGSTGTARAFSVTTTDVGADSIDAISFDLLVNGTTSAIIASYSSGSAFFWIGTGTGLIPVGSSTDLGTHSGLCRVYGVRG